MAGIDKPQPRRRCVEVHHVPGTRRQVEPEETHWNLSLPPPFYPFLSAESLSCSYLENRGLAWAFTDQGDRRRHTPYLQGPCLQLMLTE